MHVATSLEKQVASRQQKSKLALNLNLMKYHTLFTNISISFTKYISIVILSFPETTFEERNILFALLLLLLLLF